VIKYAGTKSPKGSNVVELEVLQEEMSITVKAGSFRVRGVDYDLIEDQVFTATERPERTDAVAFLVKQKSDDSIIVVVDELVFDEDSGWPDHYDWENSPYEKLKRIWNSNFPSNMTSLDDVVIYANRIVDSIRKW
jgi:hypothetical protein